MRTDDATGTRTWLVATVLIVAILGGCWGGEAPPRGRPPDALVPAGAPDRPMSAHRLGKLAHLLDRVELLDRVGPEYELRDVEYTSPTDAVAYFLDNRINGDRGSVVATTDDGWAHSARLRISDDLADLIDYLPLGRGAVAVKAQRNYPDRKTYPPFVLYPDGRVEPLRVAEPRSLDADSELVTLGVHNLFHERTDAPGLWAADVADAEVFPVLGSPLGHVRQHVPGRPGEVMSVVGYRHGVGDGVWRYETTTDAGRSWRRTDVRLPLRRRYLWRYSDVTTHAVGPRHLQAIAMSHAWEDLPLSMWELWWTDDEERFRRVPLPWDRLKFGGMAFASDGALLIAEVLGSDGYCDSLVCNRRGRILRLAPGGNQPEPLRGAPRLFGPFWAVGIHFSGGLIVARTGLRTVATSEDGYSWTTVRPGRADDPAPARSPSQLPGA